MGGAGAAEEAMLWYQVFVCIHSIVHFLPTDQTAVELRIRRTRQVHTVITLEEESSSVCNGAFQALANGRHQEVRQSRPE